jgi:hypothetical protein
MGGGKWVDTEKIRVGPISNEQRRAIDKFLALSLAQHRRTIVLPRTRQGDCPVFGAVAKPEPERKAKTGRKYTPSPQQIARLREQNRLKHEAAIARKQEAVAGAFDHSYPQPERGPVLRVPGGPEIAHRADGMREAHL